jgi:voltage-gated potassium channel
MRGGNAGAYERFQRQAEIPMLVLSLAFVPIIVIPLIGDPSPAVRSGLEATAWFIWAAFVAEYLTLLYLAPDRWRMVRTHVLDLAIIALPFLRPLRILRVVPALVGLGRSLVAARRISQRPGFRGFVAFAAVLVVAGGLVVYAFERSEAGSNITSPADALWWAIVTSTTVGYGDHFPQSAGGRGVAVVLMLLGIALFSVVTANIAAYFVESGDPDADAVTLEELRDRLERIEQALQQGTPYQGGESGVSSPPSA